MSDRLSIQCCPSKGGQLGLPENMTKVLLPCLPLSPFSFLSSVVLCQPEASAGLSPSVGPADGCSVGSPLWMMGTDFQQLVVLSLLWLPPLQVNSFPTSESLKFSASQPLPPHNPLLDGHFPVLPRKKGIALGGRGEGVGTSRPFIIARGRGEWDTGQSVPSSHCPLELRKTYSAPPKPVAIQPCVPASLLRYGLLASEHVLRTGSLTTAVPQ